MFSLHFLTDFLGFQLRHFQRVGDIMLLVTFFSGGAGCGNRDWNSIFPNLWIIMVWSAPWISTPFPWRLTLPCHTGSMPSHSFVLPLKGWTPLLAPLLGRCPYGIIPSASPCFRCRCIKRYFLLEMSEALNLVLCCHLKLGLAYRTQYIYRVIANLFCPQCV